MFEIQHLFRVEVTTGFRFRVKEMGSLRLGYSRGWVIRDAC